MFQRRSITRFVLLLTAVTSCLIARSLRADDIHRFVEKGQLERVKALLDADPKQVSAPDRNDDRNDETPLHIAVYRRHREIVKLLLERGADVNAIAYNRFTPLHLAQDGESVKLLVAHKANLEARDSSNRTALENAAFLAAGRPDTPDNPWWQIAKTLLKSGAYYDIRTAALLGDVERVGVLLKAKPGEARDRTLMRFAAMHGHAAVVKLLLEHKADPTDADYGGLPLLDFAINYPAVVRLLIDAGADPKVRLNYRGNGQGPPGDSTLLHSAAIRGQVETAEILLAHGVPIDARAAGGHTPLEFAAFSGQPEMVKFLLSKKARLAGGVGEDAMFAATHGLRATDDKDKGDKDKAEENARYKAVVEILHERGGVAIDLFTAIALGKTDYVKKLLKEKPALSATKNAEGAPALCEAVKFNQKEMVAVLLDTGSPVNSTDDSGDTALHSAAFWGREEIAKLLIDRKADVNAAAKSGFTPLHESARLATPAVAKLLLAHGAKVNARDDRGYTPLSWAQTNADRTEENGAKVPEVVKQTIELLRKHGGTK